MPRDVYLDITDWFAWRHRYPNFFEKDVWQTTFNFAGNDAEVNVKVQVAYRRYFGFDQ